MKSLATTADDLTIRAAVPEDALALAEFAERAFRDAFESDNTSSDMAQHAASAFGERLQHGEITDTRRVVLLAEDGNGIAGFAQLLRGSTPIGITATPAIELERFYVEREWHGRGLAQRLMQRVIAAALQSDAATLWLGVWERNPRAIAFYRKSGFIDVGAKPFLLGSDLQTDRIMCRPVRD